MRKKKRHRSGIARVRVGRVGGAARCGGGGGGGDWR
jgi:hypothetical protein